MIHKSQYAVDLLLNPFNPSPENKKGEKLEGVGAGAYVADTSLAWLSEVSMHQNHLEGRLKRVVELH